MRWAWGQSSTAPAARGLPPSRPVIGLGARVPAPARRGVPAGRRVGGGGGGGGKSGGRERARERASEGAGEPGGRREARAAGKESPAGSAPPPRAGRGAGAAGRCTALLGPPVAPAAFREEAAPAAAPALARASSPAAGRVQGRVRGRRDPEEECRLGRSRRSPAARERLRPARGAGSMATGLGEPVYGLSEDEVSGSLFPPGTPRGIPAPRRQGMGTPGVRVARVCRAAPNTGAPRSGVPGGLLGPSARRRRPLPPAQLIVCK